MDQAGALKILIGYPLTDLGLRLYGKNWKKIEEVVGTRNGSQIRSHAQKFFLKVKKSIESTEH